MYSNKVNEALERYGAKTHGSLERRVERLKRFTDITNKRYADQVRSNNEFLDALDRREHRIQQNGLNLLWEAIQNGHVNTRRGPQQ
jgi:hypothetical protein